MKITRLLLKKGIPVIDLVILIFFSLFYVLPVVNSSISKPLVLLVGFMYYCYVFVKDRETAKRFISVFVAVTFLAFAYVLLTETKTVSALASNRELKHLFSKFSQYFFMCFPGLLVTRTIKTSTPEQKRLVLLFIAILFSVVFYNTLQEIRLNPYAMREWAGFNELENKNSGNYYFVYAVPIIMVGLSACMTKLKLIPKLLSTGTIIFLYYFLFEAKYTLAIIIATLGFLLQVFLSLKTIYSKIILIIVISCVSMFIPSILLYVSQNVDSVQMSIRFKELYDFFVSGDSSGHNMKGRLTLYSKSIEAFLRSPLFGNKILDFDGHATCLTVLSDTGLIGGIPFYYILHFMKKNTSDLLQKESVLFIPIFFCLLCMGFTNPIHSSLPLSFSVWFIVPLIIDTFINREGVYKK